ncbi:transposase, partial [Bradyrhizobium yuanmingense]|uniref:transposase n=1 Tax=Bradyrhizobium yuanmingense TaxID=108015 RepID=UPI00201CAA14
MVRGTVEETLNAMLEAEADQLCGAGRYERSPAQQDTRAGSYERTLHTKAGDFNRYCPESFALLIRRRLRFQRVVADRAVACSCSIWSTTPFRQCA